MPITSFLVSKPILKITKIHFSPLFYNNKLSISSLCISSIHFGIKVVRDKEFDRSREINSEVRSLGIIE